MPKADYLEIEFLKWASGQAGVLGSGVQGPYVALYTAPPGDAGGGAEVSGGSYVRANSDNKWGAPVSGTVSNNAEIAFAKATAPWGDIVAIGLFDTPTAGNLLYWGTIPAKTVGVNEIARFLAGAIILGED